jgi:hypothetical protein
MSAWDHFHECRDCGADIGCDGGDGWDCREWDGGNSGCVCADDTTDTYAECGAL